MKRLFFLALAVCVSIPALLSIKLQNEDVRIHNESAFDLYGATYYYHKDAERLSEVKPIKSGQVVSFKRPSRKLLKDRRVVFSLAQDDLKQKMISGDYHLLPQVAIGLGNDFFLDLVKGSFKGYNAVEWRLYLPLKEKLAGVVKMIDASTFGQIRRRYLSRKPLPVQVKNAQIRRGTDLPAEEVAYIKKRLPVIQKGLSKFLDTQVAIDKVPTITVAGSGGGYRAMLGFLGLLKGAQETGLLDTISHVSGLSGSTWTLGPWISSGWSLDEFEQRLLPKIETPLTDFKPKISQLLNSLMTRLAFNQPLTGVNAYGRILGNNLLSDLPKGPFGTYLRDQRDAIENGSLPFPIYTAVSTKLPYQWVEFTPYEMGGDYFGGYIPISTFGASFLNGKMVGQTPPYSLPFILAICGSAFAAQLNRVIEEEINPKLPIKSLRDALKVSAEELRFGKHRISPARVFNWTWGMRPLPRAEQEVIKLVDGGLSYNFGLEALYRRKPHFILIGDFSKTQDGSELKKAEKDLRERGFKVPPIDYTDIDKKPFSIFKDPNDPTVPVIIYLPQVHNKNFSDFDPASCKSSWCDTFNFKYKKEEARKLIGLSRQSMIDAAPAIKDEIKNWIAKQG